MRVLTTRKHLLKIYIHRTSSLWLKWKRDVFKSEEVPEQVPEHQIDKRNFHGLCFSQSRVVRISSREFKYQLESSGEPTFSHKDCSGLETKLQNGVTIYGREDAVVQLAEVVNSYPNLWIDTGNVTIPESQYLEIPLLDNWRDNLQSRASEGISYK